MKIAMVCYPTHGGSGVVATELGLELARRDHEVHFISYSAPFRLRGYQENVFFHEVDVSAYPLFKYPPYDLSLATKILEVDREHDLDIVHAHYAIPHAVSAYLARQMTRGPGPGLVTTLHGTDITLVGGEPSFFEAVRFCLHESDAVTAVSAYLARRTAEEFDVEKEIEVVHNFVDTDRFNGSTEDCIVEHFAPNNEKLLLHASNFRPVKRLVDVIEILAAVRRRVPARLLLIGEGPDRSASHERAEKLGVLDDVIYLGTQDYIENLLGCADLFLLPSSEESFGLVALEALSCRTPVIGSRVGGLPEVVAHEVNGYLRPVGDTGAMAEDAIRLLTQPERLTRFKDEARRIAVDRFDSRHIIPQYEAVYRAVLERRSQKSDAKR